LLGGLLQPVTDVVGGLTGGQGLGGALEPVTGAVGQVGEGLGQGLGNVLGGLGGSSGKQYDPEDIGYYRQIMERQGPPMVYSNQQLRERLQIEREFGQLRQQYPQPPEYMGQLIQILQILMQLQIEQGYQIRQIMQYLQNK
jgi:hypothetical protein